MSPSALRLANRTYAMTPRHLVRRLAFSLAALGAVAIPSLTFAEEAQVKSTATAPTVASNLPEASPASVGVDAAQLVRLSQWIRDQNLDVRSLLVVKVGKLVFERYSGGL